MKSTLIMYKGGGYDGCFWEWNFALWDENGEFEPLLTTGNAGCSQEHDLLELMLRSKRCGNFYAAALDDNLIGTAITSKMIKKRLKAIGWWRDSLRVIIKIEPVHLESLESFATETNEGLIKQIAGDVRDITGTEIPVKCDYCDELGPATEASNTGCSGAGGLATKFTGWICDNCRSANTCNCCGELQTREYRFVDTDGGDYCGECALLQKIITEEEYEELEKKAESNGSRTLGN